MNKTVLMSGAATGDIEGQRGRNLFTCETSTFLNLRFLRNIVFRISLHHNMQYSLFSVGPGGSRDGGINSPVMRVFSERAGFSFVVVLKKKNGGKKSS